jgi:hypothetical protein
VDRKLTGRRSRTKPAGSSGGSAHGPPRAPRRFATFAVAGIVGLSACGYFNSLYNARRSFDEARAAERRGASIEAATAYRAAIDDAAATWTGHGDGRWGDDALLLIGRSHYALGDYEASRAAFLTLLEDQPGGGLAADAQAWLGASEAALDNRLVARSHLDSALVADPSGEARAVAQLWRGRIAFALGEPDPWTFLDAAARSGTVFAPHASLSIAAGAIESGDTIRARFAIDRLLADRTAARWSDSITTLVDAMAGTFGPAFTRSALARMDDAEWPADVRERQLLRRAMLAAEAGDTATAIADAISLADRSTPGTAAAARLEAARWRLASVDDVAQLEEVRAILLPVITDGLVRQLVRDMGAIDVLIRQAVDDGQTLGFFAAAEIARESLGAPALASRLFVTYADLAPASVWAPKALLAAVALETGASGGHDELVGRIRQRPDNPYASSVLTGSSDAEAFLAAEQRLSESLVPILRDARRVAAARDVRVGAAVARIDSIRAAALADSTRIACGILIDSLALRGIRSDSTRVACMRSDSARVAEVLTIDTMLLIDTTAVRDTSRIRRSTDPRFPFERGRR